MARDEEEGNGLDGDLGTDPVTGFRTSVTNRDPLE
jgi:hypothetical protein